MNSRFARSAPADAFSLVEVALALGVAAFCIVPLVALLPVGLKSNQIASAQMTASSIITDVLADLRATASNTPPGSAATSAGYFIAIPADTTGGASTSQVLYFGDGLQQFSVTQQSGSRFRLTVTFLPPAGDRTATWATLLVTWPAGLASANPQANRVQVFSALNRN